VRVGDFEVDAEAAGRWLAEGYPSEPVRYYDYAGLDDRDAARSPTDRVELADLGRMVCIAASLTYQRGHRLMEQSVGAEWPTDVMPLGEIVGEDDEFHEDPTVEAMWQVFSYWHGKADLAFGTVSKLLHIKWPAFIPITDSEVTSVYRQRAVARHNNSSRIRTELRDKRKRTSTANIRGYWHEIRDDLVAATDEFQLIRDELQRVAADAADDVPTVEHVTRLLGLTNLRLLDAIAWELGRNSGELGANTT
jgi:hypothetical protein